MSPSFSFDKRGQVLGNDHTLFLRSRGDTWCFVAGDHVALDTAADAAASRRRTTMIGLPRNSMRTMRTG